MVKQLLEKFRSFDGPLTRDILLHPSKYGLGHLPEKISPDSTTTVTCGFCSTGCGLRMLVKEGEAQGLSPDSEYPVNSGMACPKGWEALTPLKAVDRGTTPLVKSDGHLKECSWEDAIDIFCERFSSIIDKHGKESVAFLSTGQIPIEEMAMLGAFAKFGMGMVHGDGNTRQCMATAAVSYKQSFGFDAPPYSYTDFEESDLLIFVGANPCIAHPILWERVLKNKCDGEIVVIDPRKTETATAAHLHIPIQPKSDLTFFYCLANALIEMNACDQKYIEEHCDDFESFRDFVKDYKAENYDNIDNEAIQNLAQKIANKERVSFWWTMGVNQSHEGVLTAQAMINIALMTGNIGRPGTGANSITGQTNAMGSRIFSNTTNLFAGRDFENEDHRREVANILGITENSIPQQNSLAYPDIMEKIDKGEIKGLWVIATNPGHSWIDRHNFDKLMDKLDFLVVQDMYNNTETVKHADLFLPAAGWGEKEGVVINSERRLGLFKKRKRAPGQALADFYIFRLLAERWGCGEMFREWNSPAEVFAVLKKLSAGRPCDITGIKNYQHIDESGGIQWPFILNEEDEQQERRLFEKGGYYHSNGKAKFKFGEPKEPEEKLVDEFPLVLLTGRGSSAQWHTGTRTKKSFILQKLHPSEPWVEINPEDAKVFGIEHSDLVEVSSKRGKAKVRAQISWGMQKGQLFMPMHDKQTNLLTHPSFDPQSRQPSYKYSAVSIKKLY